MLCIGPFRKCDAMKHPAYVPKRVCSDCTYGYQVNVASAANYNNTLRHQDNSK